MSKRLYSLGQSGRWGHKSLIAYLAFISAFAPLSTDMYLPALPQLTAALNTTASLSSLTVSSFLLLFALSMVIWGALSDKYGRKPILLLGVGLYVASSLAIVFADSITAVLLWRCVQAVGSGAVSAMSLAIVKDILRGESLERVVTWIQTITILAPMCAPVLGGVMLQWTDWRGIFQCLALCGVLALVGAVPLAETRPCPVTGTAFQALGRIGVVLQNQKFFHLLWLFSAMCMPFMCYLAISSYVFQETFGYSAQAYSAFFAFNATMSLLGPISHACIFSSYGKSQVMAAYLLITCLSGVLLLLWGDYSAWMFALMCAPISFCSSALRPPSTVLMMNLFSRDSGTVTALINSGGLLLGSVAMLLCALPIWGSFIHAQGVVSLCVGGISLYAWLRLSSRTTVYSCYIDK